MSIEESPKIGRRSVLAAVTGAVAALVGHAVTTPSRALAADHDPVKIGEVNVGYTATVLTVATPDALEARSGGGDALRGWSAAAAKSGCYAWNTNPGGFGVVGQNTAAGTIGSVGGPLDGVSGLGLQPSNAGVRGASSNPEGWGVIAANSSQETSVKLAGRVGVFSEAPAPNGFALVAAGKVEFYRSGVVTIPAGKKTVKVSSVAVTNGSFVFATMQYPRSGVYIAAAVPNVDTDSITIYLNKGVTYATKVAWFVLDHMVA
jgi:hypothetical protein